MTRLDGDIKEEDSIKINYLDNNSSNQDHELRREARICLKQLMN